MMKKWIMMFSVLMLTFGMESLTYGEKAQTLGGKNQQVIVQTATGGFKRGWIIPDSTGKKTLLTTSGEKVVLSDTDKPQKIAELEKEYTKQQHDVRDKKEGETSDYVRLLDWGQSRQLFEAVQQLSQKILKRNPSNPNPDAKRASEWAKDQLKQMNATRLSSSGGGEGDWNMEKVQKIRFALLGTSAYGETNPMIAFKNNVLNRFMTDMAAKGQYQSKEEQKKFLRLPAIEQALTIKKETGFQYQPDITVNRDPALILDFRTKIQPLLAKSCAQAACHGGEKAKWQISTKANQLPMVYRNYYVLDTYRTSQGSVIDHVRPEVNSLLINYLVSSDLAPGHLTHTPPITNPAIRSKEDPRYQQLVDWLKAQPKESLDVLLGEKVSTSQPMQGIRQ